jgi:preprotein translocase subunit SecY
MKKLNQIKKPIKTERSNKKFIWIITLLIIFFVIIGIIAFGYHQNVKEEKYLQGGKDAMNQLVDSINSFGGVVITLEDNQNISIAKYNKN